jgi:hypothetical protein
MFTSEWFREQALLGNMYHACSAGAVTLSTVSTTCTGLALSNPPGSGKNLVIKTVSFQPSTAPAGAAVVGLSIHTALSSVDSTHTTPMVIHNAKASGAVSNCKARADAAATLISTPLWLRPIGGVVAASTLTPGKYTENVDGDIIIPPGGVLSLSYLTTAAVGIAAVTWVEVDE